MYALRRAFIKKVNGELDHSEGNIFTGKFIYLDYW